MSSLNGLPRVALVTLSAPPGARGGVEVLDEQLRRALVNVEIIEDPPAPRPSRLGDLHRAGLDPPARALLAAREFLRRHREEPFDLVISNGVAGWPLTFARLAIPAVQLYHLTLRGLARQALRLRGDRFTTGRVAGMFDRLAGVGKEVVAVSPRVLGEVEAYYRLRGRWIPPGIDASEFAPMNRAEARRALGLPQDGPLGLFAGRPDYSKGFDILVRVARRCPDVSFIVAGGERVPESNLRAVGRIPHAEMPLWYAASDFLINPSRYEGFNLVILEALSCDRPVIASGAAFSIPEDPARCGVVVHQNEADEYVRGIRDVLETGPLRPRDVVVPRYSFERFTAAWRVLATSLVERGSNGDPDPTPQAADRAPPLSLPRDRPRARPPDAGDPR